MANPSNPARMKMEMTFRDDVRDVIAHMRAGRDDVKPTKMMGLPTHVTRSNGKMFVGIHGDGISLKLPQERIDELLASRPDEVSPFRPRGRAMSGWVQIDHEEAEAFASEQELLEDSIAFVGSQPAKASTRSKGC